MRSRKKLVEASTIADVTGFLYTGKQVKRLSRIKFAYMIPTLDSILSGATASYPELHVRYTPKAERREQAIYHVEVSSSLYSFVSQLDITDIGILNYCEKQDDNLIRQRKERVKAAIDALIGMLDGVLFGAKRSRFMPQWSIKSLLVTVSKMPIEYIPYPGLDKRYIRRSYERALSLVNIVDGNISMYAYIDEELERPKIVENENILFTEESTHTEALRKAKRDALKYFEEVNKAETG